MLADVDRNKVEKTQSDDAAASTLIKIMEESEYEQVTGEQVELEPGQALVFRQNRKIMDMTRLNWEIRRMK